MERKTEKDITSNEVKKSQPIDILEFLEEKLSKSKKKIDELEKEYNRLLNQSNEPAGLKFKIIQGGLEPTR